jgi:hypothetical protein
VSADLMTCLGPLGHIGWTREVGMCVSVMLLICVSSHGVLMTGG